MKNAESWRWSEIALLIVILGLLFSIIAILASRIVPVPFGSKVSPTLTSSTDAIAASGFTTVFTLAENASAAIKDYQQHFLQNIGLLVVGSIGFLYGVALLVYSLIVRLKTPRRVYAVVAIGGFNLIWVGLGGLNILNDTQVVSNCASLQNTYDSRQYRITEGTVHVSHVQPDTGHDKGDIFTVGTVGFEVSHFVSYCAYGKTIAYGGVLTEGTYAKVFYADNRTILRIDVKNQ